jgi:hypothetical protein
VGIYGARNAISQFIITRNEAMGGGRISSTIAPFLGTARARTCNHETCADDLPYKLTWAEIVKLYRLTLDQPAHREQIGNVSSCRNTATCPPRDPEPVADSA